MRSINKTAINFARLAILVLCFMLSFAIILASPLADSTANVVAQAEEGTMVRLPGDNGELGADYFGFPGNTGSTRTWTKTETFTSTYFSEESVSMYNSNTKRGMSISAGTGSFNFGHTSTSGDTTNGYQMFVVFNYDMSTFLKNLISSHSNVTVKAELTARIVKNRGNNSGLKAIATDKMMSGAELSSFVGGQELTSSGLGFTAKDSDDTTLTSSATLTASNPNLALAFAFGGGLYYAGEKARATVSNITVKFTLSMSTPNDSASTVIEDNKAPIVKAAQNVYPNRPNNTNTNAHQWAYYPQGADITKNIEDNILGMYKNNIDYIDNNYNIFNNSYVDASRNAKTVGGKTYYKSVTSTVVDQYSYGSATTKVTQNSNFQWFASGIKSVKIGDNIHYLYNGSSGLVEIAVTENGVKTVYGWFRVTKTHRAEVYIEMFFAKNGSFSMTVTDYGDKQVSKSITINGIDLHDPTSMETFSDENKDYFLESSAFTGVSSWDTIKWHNLSTLSFDFNEDLTETEDGHSPYVWFYSVKKSSTPTALTSANWSREQLLYKMPFAVNGLSFNYDFTTGYANATYKNGVIQYGVDNQNDGLNATGSGYYLFTFYKMDLSGRYNAAVNTRSYYVKVDCDQAVHTVNKSAGAINLNNPDWAAGAPLVITLTQEKANISGNTLSFTYLDDNDNEMVANVFVNKDGVILGGTDNTFVIDEGLGSEITVTYRRENKSGIWTITFGARPMTIEQGVERYRNLNYVTTFDISTGIDLEAANLITYTAKGEDVVTNGVTHGKWQYAVGKTYQNGVMIRVDRNRPLAPNLMNRDELEGEYIVELGEYEIPEISNRTWYTDSWIYPAQFDFVEELIGEFGADIKVYYAMKNIVDVSDFTVGANGKLSIAQFVSDYLTASNLALYDFDYFFNYTGDKLDELNSLDLGLDSDLGAGMRVYFFWTVDQAGNKSDLHKYYILADATTYYLTGHIVDGEFFGQTDVTIVSGSAKTAYKRGTYATLDYDINTDSPYVPYKLMVDSGGAELYTLWITDNPTSRDIVYDEAPVSVDGTTFTLFMDSVDGTLDKMDTKSGDSMDVYFYYREYVKIVITNNSVYYAGEPTTVPYTISSDKAVEHIIYNFEGFAEGERPVNVGEYKFTMHIETDSYISDAPVETPYYINKKPVEIRINATSGTYGDAQYFGYTVNGLVGKDLAAWDPVRYTFTPESGLSLPLPENWILLGTQNLAANNFANKAVGAYRLTFDLTLSNGAISDNYELPTLVEEKHVITQRELTISVVEGTKVFGDQDEEINFVIDYATLPSGIDHTNITSIFKNATVVMAETSSERITMTGKALITRQAGEDVGEYEYNTSTSAFDVDSNYKVRIDVTDKKFVITRKTVTVTPNSGQEFIWSDLEDYAIVYSLDDYRFGDALNAIWTFTQIGDMQTILGFDNYEMEVGGTMESTSPNVEFVLTSGVTIIVKKAVAEQKSIVISNTSGIITKVYDGTATLESVVITAADTAGFEYVVTGGELPEGFRIEIRPTSTGVNVGNYVVAVDRLAVTVYDANDEQVSGYNILVESYTLSIIPATVKVYPTFGNTAKTYGDLDSFYDFGFEVEENAFSSSVMFGEVISGSFVRAIYQGESVVALGERYDGVSAADGTFEKGGVAYRYGVAVGNVFTSSDPNFTVEVVDLSTYSLAINPRPIDFSVVDKSGVYANSRPKTGDNRVNFLENEKIMMFDISGQLVLVQDDVHVDFTAIFSEETGLEAGDNKKVLFAEFILIGADSGNYVLINADGEVIEVLNTKDGGTIKITEDDLRIDKMYFNIIKVYDGTSTITEENIVISDACMLKGYSFYIANDVSFDSADATTNFATDLVLVFMNVDENTFTYSEGTLEKITFLAGKMMRLSLADISGTITPKEINIEDITSISALDRTYNGKATIDVNFTLNSNVLGIGDTQNDVDMKFVATADSINVGERQVVIGDVVVGSKNYVANFTAAEISSKTALKATISRAKVELNVDYNKDKEYNGRDNQALTKGAGNDVAQGSGYAFRLVSDIDMDADAWTREIGAIGWNFDTTVFTYTIDGVANSNVAYSSGVVVKHNVLVSGLTLTTANPASLNNYEIVAYSWNGTEYEASPVVLKEGTLENFECLGVAPMAQKVIKANNNITVLDKVYDGTRTAYAQSNVLDFGILAGDAPYVTLKFDANYETKNVGAQTVSLRIVGFANNADATEDVAANYLIKSETTWTTTSRINPAPMVVEANVGEKVYDGTDNLEIGRISYEYLGRFLEEADTYTVNVLAGHYVDANVFNADGTVPEFKDAKLYGIELKNLSTSKVNYYPVIASATEIVGLTEITELGALPSEDAEGNHIYYYAVPTENVYILTASEYDGLATKPDAEQVIGTYTRAGKVYYMVSESAALEGFTTQAVSVSTNAKGKILPKSVSIAVEVLNRDAFDREYDGTTIFNGVLGTDYQVGTAGGFVGTDNNYVSLDESKFTAEYTSVNSGVTDVKFVFSDGALIGDGVNYTYLNYTATGATYLVRAMIKQVQMEVTLGAINATYGDDTSAYDLTVDYAIVEGGSQYAVTIVDGRGYMALDDFALVYTASWNSLTTEQQNARRFNFVEGAFVQAEDGAYVRLTDTFASPKMVTNANKQTIVGKYNATLQGGSATNYKFNFKYSKFVDGVSTPDDTHTSSEVVIGKKELLVSAKQGSGEYSYVADYLGALPTIVLSYAGFVNGNGAPSITVGDGAVEFKFFDGANLVDVPDQAKPTEKLAEGQYYVAVIDLAKFSAQNYFFAQGAEAYLNIVIPELKGITVSDTTVTYDGSAQNGKLAVTGSTSGVTKNIKFYKGEVVAPEFEVAEVKNVGTYTVVATFTKAIGSEGYTQSTTVTRTMTVNKATINVDPQIGGYDYHDYNYTKDIEKAIFGAISGVASGDLSTVKDNVEIIFYQVAEKGNKEVKKIEDAGSYAVEVIFTAPTEPANADQVILANYNDLKKTYNFKVNQAPITLNILESAIKVVGEFDLDGSIILPETLVIPFTYDFTRDYKTKYGLDSNSIDPSRFQIQFSSGGKAQAASSVITGSGSFEFSIVYLEKSASTVTDYEVEGYKALEIGVDDKPSKDIDGNYRLISNFGNYNVSSTEFGDEFFAIEFLDGVGVVSSKGLVLETTEIYIDEVDEDLYDYFLRVDSHAGLISTSTHKASLESVTQLRLRSAGEIVQPNSPVKVSVQLYLVEDVSEYVFYTVGRDGKLHKLEEGTFTIDEDGYLEYTTDFIDAVAAFHMEGQEDDSLPWWIWLIVGIGGALIIVVIITVSVIATKKKKKKQDNPDGESDGDTSEEEKTEEDNEDVPEEQKEEEGTPEESKPEDAAPNNADATPAEGEAPAETSETAQGEEPKAEEPVTPKKRPSKPSVIGTKKKPPVIGQRVMAPGADPATAQSAALVGGGATPVAEAPATPSAETPAKTPVTETPAEVSTPETEKVNEAPAVEETKAPEIAEESNKGETKDKKQPVVAVKKPPTVGKKPPVVGKKPPVVGKK